MTTINTQPSTLRAHLQSLNADDLWNTLCTNTPGGIDASTMSTEEMIEYGVDNWAPGAMATPEEIERAREEYATDDISIDAGAKASRADEGVWVAAWVWLPSETTDEDKGE